jgi:putative ABC transport system substrate-binding protein
MKRRQFLGGAAGVLAWSVTGRARAAAPIRIGWISAGQPAASAVFLEALRAGLADLSHVERRSYTIEARYGEDNLDRVPSLIEDLRKLQVDMIATNGPATRVVVWSVRDLPVLYVFSADPVGAGFAQSFARPGRNSTGICLMSVEMNGKRMEMVREILPKARRVAIIANPGHVGEHLERAQSEETARQLGIEVRYFSTPNRDVFNEALTAIAADPPDALLTFPDPLTIQNRQTLAGLAIDLRIPFISGWATFAESGALCTYGPRLAESYRRLAYYVDRVGKGSRPAELPIELPSVFELVINMKTAKALGLTLPPALLARADTVIE